MGTSEDDSSDSDGEERTHSKDGEPIDKDAEKAARKQHKRDVKEANKEKRKHKIPKHVKKKQTLKGKKKR